MALVATYLVAGRYGVCKNQLWESMGKLQFLVHLHVVPSI